MAIKLTSREFFTEKLDESLEGLSGIGARFLNEGEAAAEKQFADFIRNGGLDTASYFSDSNPTLTEKLVAEGDRILDGWLSSCGVPIRFPERKVDWFANPTYNKYAEWTWQLSRHPEWSKLATLYRLTGEEKYAEAFQDYFMSWSEQTEAPPHGTSGYATLAWRSLECGLRLESSWLYSIMAFSKSPSIKDHTIASFFRSVWDNVDRILDSSTTHNWLITEMCGLDATATCYTFFKESAEWGRYSMSRLEEEFDVQIYDDGFQFELTTGYHRVIINTYAGSIRLHEKMGAPLGLDFKLKVANLYRLYIKLMMPDKTSPSLNDGGRIDTPAVCREAIALMPDFKPEFNYIATGEGEKPAFDSILMKNSGFAIMRSGWEEDDSCAILESAPFGYAHQHEDKLQIMLHAHGKRLLDDPGSFRYDTSPMRKYILSSYSHNVALVDGLGQNRRATYKWQRDFIKKEADVSASLSPEADAEAAMGFYDEGYGPDLIPVRHERTLIWYKKGLGEIDVPFYVVYDKFIPADEKEHKYTLLWHLDEVEVTACGNVVDADYKDGVHFATVGMTEAKIVKAQTEPYMLGWKPNHTPGDNPHYPTPTVTYEYSGASVAVATALVPTKNTENPITAVGCDADGNITVSTASASYTFNKNELVKAI